MKTWAWMAVLTLVCGALCAGVYDDPRIFKRGDANNDGLVNTTDASFINNFLYRRGPEPPCMANADVNDDGLVDGADSAFIWNWLLLGGPTPPPPGPWNPNCEPDPTQPHLGCLDYYCE